MCPLMSQDNLLALVSLWSSSVNMWVYHFLSGMYGLPRPWYFPLQRSYWSGSGRVETWDWPWCGGGATRLSVMEEDQACAMDHRRTGMDKLNLADSFSLLWVYLILSLLENFSATIFVCYCIYRDHTKCMFRMVLPSPIFIHLNIIWYQHEWLLPETHIPI